jgi:hypothetical protein
VGCTSFLGLELSILIVSACRGGRPEYFHKTYVIEGCPQMESEGRPFASSKKKDPQLSSVVMGNLIFKLLAIAAGVVIPGLFLYAITRSILAAIHGLHRR